MRNEPKGRPATALDPDAKAAYAACYRRYGHANGPMDRLMAVPLDQAFESLSEEQRQMWSDVAAAVKEAVAKRASAG